MTDPSPAASKSLLLSRRFAPLFWCQFFSAFSDNFLKNALAFLIVFHIGGSLAEPLTQLAAAVFIAPYFFLSAFGGQMADRYDKAIVARRLIRLPLWFGMGDLVQRVIDEVTNVLDR